MISRRALLHRGLGAAAGLSQLGGVARALAERSDAWHHAGSGFFRVLRGPGDARRTRWKRCWGETSRGSSGRSVAERRPALAVLGLLALILPSCGSSESPIVGEWKGRSSLGYTQDAAEFSAGGACKLSQGGARQVCAWSREADGSIKISYGTERPATTVRGTITGDQMWFMQGDHTESSWIRKGSELDACVAAYSKGQELIQAGDYEQGMAALKEAADRGFEGAQNSLAWNYAAARDPRFRDGKKAVAYAQKAVAQTHHYQYLDTLAVSLARDGQFEAAVKAETKALGLLEKDADRPAADREAAEGRFRGRIALFRQRQPYTEP